MTQKEITEELIVIANDLVKLLEIFDYNNMNHIQKYELLKSPVTFFTPVIELILYQGRFKQVNSTGYTIQEVRAILLIIQNRSMRFVSTSSLIFSFLFLINT